MFQKMARPFETLMSNRDLFVRLLVRDLQATVRGSVLGLAWIVISPLAMVAIYTFVFGTILDSVWTVGDPEPLEVPLIYLTGLVIFGFFMEVMLRAPDYIRVNKTYVTKIVFPVELLDWVLVGSAAAKLLISFVVIIVFLVLLTGTVPPAALLLPFIVLPFVFLATGLAWFLSAFGTYVRDAGHAMIAFAPALMFMSPIFYSAEQVPDSVRWIYSFNPLTFVTETTRGILFFDQGVTLADYGGYWCAALAVFFAGYWFFTRARRGFSDVL
ncbi:MAG: ABC transporter permease [Hoeflea sp.]|uniref:ABC transporter permease n=1 Tax=Hoeflea sp. TaxID=1940281 RepID=UPI0032EEFB22